MVFVGIGIALNDTHVGTLAGTGCANGKILVRPMTAGAQVIDAYFPNYSVPHRNVVCFPSMRSSCNEILSLRGKYPDIFSGVLSVLSDKYSDILSGVI